MAVECSECGTGLRDGARFCDSCGSAIKTWSSAPEFKQVTVLFADVVRSMDMASALGTERLREVMSELLSRSRAVVDRYGGTVDFTGDGIMAIFGAPIALEDHAFRGCLAALEIQQQARSLADDLRRRDGVDLMLRVGLNSGEVIAGEIDSRPGRYTAVGAHVGMAQRMEAAAPPGGVMLSSSTARLVETVVQMGDIEPVRIKNVDQAVPARRLISVVPRGRERQFRAPLLGRDREVKALCGVMEEALAGHGAVAGIVGPPGIGKSRLVAEFMEMAAERGVEAVVAFCEAHAREVPFHAAAQVFRQITGLADERGRAARENLRTCLAGAGTENLSLLDDLLGISDPSVESPTIGPDARRRRLASLLTTAAAARGAPLMYVIEDAHWIDEASESLLAEAFREVDTTDALALVTYRPEYHGRLVDLATQTIAPEPLDESQSTTLIVDLLGTDPSVRAIGSKIVRRAGGNPFFAEEIVRDLAERGVLTGRPGEYVRHGDDVDTHVPATLQATIAARIDRLGGAAKRTLNAAAVIGARFDEGELATLVDPVCTAELLEAELIDKPTSAPHAEYSFRHPLIRSVAYKSQLVAARAELHRRLASAIQQQNSESLDEKAALIAMHVEAGGDLRGAFVWHMRAGNWLTLRDIVAARASWQRASEVAARLPVDDPDRVRMSVEARTPLCASGFRGDLSSAETDFDELRRLCVELGDQRSVAIGMSGLVMALAFHNRAREASTLGSELSVLLEEIADNEVTAVALFTTLAAKWETGEVVELLRLANRLLDSIGGDPLRGNLIIGSPLALTLAMRGLARMCLGQADWTSDLDRALALARKLDPFTRVVAGLHKYAQIGLGTLRADGQALRDTAETLAVAERSGDDFALSHAHLTRGITLIAQSGGHRDAGLEHLRRARCAGLEDRGNRSLVQIVDIQFARHSCEHGDVDSAIAQSRAVIDELFKSGSVLWRGPATTVLVEALLSRNAVGDLPAAKAAIERLASVPTDPGFVLHEVPLLRLRALVARAEGDEDGYLRMAVRYRQLADSCGYEGHRTMAAAME